MADWIPFVVEVPATSANLGPGFDCLGVALDLCNRVQVEPGDRLAIEINGEGSGILPRDPGNLVYKAMEALWTDCGLAPEAVRIQCVNRIPLARGLGSSSAAIVAGLTAANYMAGSPRSKEELLLLAWRLEGHPDNVAPALFGGLQVCAVEDSALIHLGVPVSQGLQAALFIPNSSISTEDARRVLPEIVPLAHAVHNVGRAALLVGALATDRLDCLRVATQDLLHQPPRQALMPAMADIIRAALEAGALGAFLSGAGSTIMALARDDALRVASAMAEAARSRGVEGTEVVARIARGGATVRSL